MKTNKAFILAVAACAAAVARADGWRLTVGPAWHSRVKMEAHGAAKVTSVPASQMRMYSDRYRDLENGDWRAYAGDAERRPDPSPTAMFGDELWAIGGDFTETTVTPSADAASLDATDVRSPLGLKAKAGYDLYGNETLSVGLDLRFAGYWNMKASAAGLAAGATTMTRTGTDWWLLCGGPYPPEAADSDPFAPAPERSASAPTTWGSETYSTAVGTAVRSRLRADLYQIGLGPTVTWHAFPWLDAYAGVAALCNIASLDFEAGASKASETQCRLGFAGEVGLAAYVTESLGLYAEVGYEWVDGFDASAGGLKADVDFSSFVVSAGVAFRF